MSKTLLEIHENVPADHYDRGIKYNLFQKYWHLRRFIEVLKVVREVEGPVLDVGCHSGTFTAKILKRVGSKKVYGIDISEQAISLAKKRIPFGNFRVGDAQKLPFKSDFFEAAFCLEVLEHVDDPVAVLKEINRILKKGGYAVLLVPSDDRLFKVIWFLWTLYYPHWRHAHVQSFKERTLESIIELVGLKISKQKSFHQGMLKLVVAEKP